MFDQIVAYMSVCMVSCIIKGVFKLPSFLKVSMDISKGMNYLYQNNVIQCD
ncbi:hypothetical protein MKX03_007128 [Papaver bracteatum]|nr:hypothetical protein MKX03_007128 [Papaver bracteatum]